MLVESPRIILGVPEVHWEYGEREGISQRYLDDLNADLEELGPEISYDLTESEIGRGASGLAVTIALAATLFLSGKKIEESLDAWVRLGRKVRRFLTKRRESSIIMVSEPLALALAAETVAVRFEVEPRALLFRQIVPLAGDPNAVAREDHFDRFPERYYVFGIRSDDGETFLVCVKSTGAIQSAQRLATTDHMSFFMDSESSEHSP